MKFYKSKRGTTGEEYTLTEIIQLILYIMAVVAFIAIGVIAYRSIRTANMDTLARNQFERLIHDTDEITIKEVPIMLRLREGDETIYNLILTNKFKDENKEKSDLKICLFKIQEDKKKELMCIVIPGNRTETEQEILFSGNYNMIVEHKTPNIINLYNTETTMQTSITQPQQPANPKTTQPSAAAQATP